MVVWISLQIVGLKLDRRLLPAAGCKVAALKTFCLLWCSYVHQVHLMQFRLRPAVSYQA
jgi:hypothetical protein